MEQEVKERPNRKEVIGSNNLRFAIFWILLAFLGSSIIFFYLLTDYFTAIDSVLAAVDMWKYGFLASFSELKVNYPRYFILAWLLTRGLVITIFIALFYKESQRFLYKRKQQSQRRKIVLPFWLCYSPYDSFYRNFRMHLTNLLVLLLVFLLFYGLGQTCVDIPSGNWNPFQLNLTRWYVIIIYLYFFILIINQWVEVKQTIASFLLEPSSAKSLAIFRILFFTFQAKFFFNQGWFFESWMQTNTLSTLPFWGSMSNVFAFVLPYYSTIIYLGIACSILISFGFFTRYLIILNALLCFLIVATPNFFGKLWHNQIFIWISWLFVASRCYDVWSIDAWWARRRGRAFEPSIRSAYSIPIRWIWVHLGMIYFFAGIFKLWNSGFDWALSDSMINQIQTEWAQHYDVIPIPRIDHYSALVKLGGLCLIFFEILFIFLLIKPATRIFAALGGLSFHNLSAHYMYIGFQDLQRAYIFLLHNARRSFFSQPQVIQKAAWDDLKWKQAPTVFKIGLVVFCLNFLCGFFSIHSYPFSSYPTYSALVADEIDLIHFIGFDEEGKEIEVLEEAQKAHFRREDCTIFETKIIEAWKANSELEPLVENYWQLWCANIPALSEIIHLKVYYHRTPVQPERRQEYIINELIYENRLR